MQPIQKQKIDIGNSWVFVKKRDIGGHNIQKISAPESIVQKIRIDKERVRKSPDNDLNQLVISKTGKRPDDVVTGSAVSNRFTSPKPGRVFDNPKAVPYDTTRTRGVERDSQFEVGRARQTGVQGSGSSSKPTGTVRSGGNSTSGTKVRQTPSGSQGYRAPESPKPSNIYRAPPDRSVPAEKPPQKQSIDHESQFRRSSSGNSQHVYSRDGQRDQDYRYRSFQDRDREAYPDPYFNRDPNGNRDRDRDYDPWFRNPRSYEPDDNDQYNNRVSPRYIDEARKLFERFGSKDEAGKASNRPDSGPSSGSKDSWKPARKTIEERIESRGSTYGRSGSKGSGVERSQPRAPSGRSTAPKSSSPPSGNHSSSSAATKKKG
jgi:hypothetical protein